MSMKDSQQMNLVECVPNFSTSDEDTIRNIIDAIEEIDTAKVLNSEADEDYNRVVITYVVEPKYAVEAAFRAIEMATAMIDMQYHSGEHPRLGAVDVFPFIPLGEVTFDTCVSLVHQLGKKVSDALDLPVYYYGRAAKNDNRTMLSDIRKGQYEGLEKKIKHPDWHPDEGEPKFNRKSGACVIGVRDILIAYNVNLAKDDIDIAQRIAREIRTSGWYKYIDGERKRVKGKLDGVQAMGVNLIRGDREFTQVSTNVLDFQNKASIHNVFEAVKEEAREHDVKVTGSEIVGMVPLESLTNAGKYYASSSEQDYVQVAIEELGLDDLENFNPGNKILEYKLSELLDQ